jgi:uncharacterized protein YrzB (UPF0473 family)
VKRLSNEDFFDEELATVLLMDEEGNEHLFELLAELDIEGDSYKVLAPMDVEEYPDDDDFEVEIVILKTINDEEGNEFLCSIEEDEEWERVADVKRIFHRNQTAVFGHCLYFHVPPLYSFFTSALFQ